MNFLNQSGLKAGAERYGAKNAESSPTDAEGRVQWLIDKHERGEHANKFYKDCPSCMAENSRENASPSERENAKDWDCPMCGTTRISSARLQQHLVDEHKLDESAADSKIDAIKKRDVQNADSSTLGYDATTSTTTARAKRKIGQKFYTPNAVDNGEKVDGVTHTSCGTQMEINRLGQMSCPECFPDEFKAVKGRHDNAADVYVPPLLTLAQKVADGQREYGAVANAASACSACDHAKANHPDWNNGGECSAPGCECKGYKA